MLAMTKHINRGNGYTHFGGDGCDKKSSEYRELAKKILLVGLHDYGGFHGDDEEIEEMMENVIMEAVAQSNVEVLDRLVEALDLDPQGYGAVPTYVIQAIIEREKKEL
jgi:hypothetical protein